MIGVGDTYAANDDDDWLGIRMCAPLPRAFPEADSKHEGRREPDPDWGSSSSLVAKLTTEQAEWQGRVPADDHVPARPFGHLHDGWRAFLEARPPTVELWSFDRRGRGNTHAEGFAFVQGGKVLSEFAYRSGDRWDGA